MISKDSAHLATMTAGGRTVRGYIELIDTGGAVLYVLDSMIVASAADSIERTGVITYMPDSTTANRPVLVRARIVADSAVAHWNVLSENFYETPDTIGSGEFAKAAQIERGRAGMVNVVENPIFLQIYPNPVAATNPRTMIAFSVPELDGGEITEVKVFDIMGRDVTTLVHDIRPTGRYTVEFDAANFPSAQFIVAVHCKSHMQSKRVVVTR